MDLSKKEKYTFLVISTLAILIIGVLGFFVYDSLLKSNDNSAPALNNTENHNQLQKYTNTEFGFGFEYPQDWEIEESPFGSPSGKFRLDIRPIGEEYPSFVSLYIVTRDYDHNSLFSRAIKSIGIVGDVEGIKYDIEYADYPGVRFFIPYEDVHLVLSADKRYEDILNQVIATFKFFPKDKTLKLLPDPKMYHNTEYGFEFEYPGDWEVKENVFGSPASMFNLNVIPSEGKHLPDPVFINIVTLGFANTVSKNLSEETSSVTTIANVNGVKYEYKSEVFNQITIILPLREYSMILGAKKQHEGVFNQVLGTFKFLD